MSAFPLLDTARLHLREMVANDAPALFAIHGTRAAMRWFGTELMTNADEAAKLVEVFASWRALPNPGTRWGIGSRTDGQLIGTCGLFKWNRAWRSCTIGYELAQERQGQGLMHEALQTILPWGFEQMALNRIEAQVHVQNQPSLRLLENLGFRREGVLRQAGFWWGEHHDLVQLSLLREDLGRTG